MIPSSWWHGVASAVSGLEDAILSLTMSAWIYFALFSVTLIDGIFPPVPSESVVIAASASWAQSGRPILWLIWLVAAVGAWCGDQIAYTIGKTIDVSKIPMLRGRRGQGALQWAETAFEHRGTAFIVAARFIPIGRVAANITAGALRYPRRRFMVIDACAAVLWASYGVALGLFAGSLLENQLLLSIAIGVAGGVLIGWLVDCIMKRAGVAPVDLPRTADLQTTKASEARRTRPNGRGPSGE